jgi:hypothetical protein
MNLIKFYKKIISNLKKFFKKIIIFIINKKWLYPQKKSVFKIYDGLEQLQEYKVDFSSESKVVTTYPVPAEFAG